MMSILISNSSFNSINNTGNHNCARSTIKTVLITILISPAIITTTTQKAATENNSIGNENSTSSNIQHHLNTKNEKQCNKHNSTNKTTRSKSENEVLTFNSNSDPGLPGLNVSESALADLTVKSFLHRFEHVGRVERRGQCVPLGSHHDHVTRWNPWGEVSFFFFLSGPDCRREE